MPPAVVYLAPWQPAEQPLSIFDRLALPLSDSYRKDGGFIVSLLAAAAAELEHQADMFAEERLQAFPHLATWALGRWERQLGLSNGQGLSTHRRQARALARFRGLTQPIGRYMQARARDALPHATEPPTIPAILAGHWAVFKPVEQGWPGDDAFCEAERRLRVAGPAANHFWLAPHDTRYGLYDGQLDLMHGEAIDVLTDAEIDGAAPPPDGLLLGLGG